MEPTPDRDDRDQTAPPSDDEMAAAGRSLADALRVSFRLLTLGMVAVLGFWALSGWRKIETGQRGVTLVFGRLQGEREDQQVVQPGLRWSWPEPIGRIETVSTQEQTLEMKDFWMHETPEEANVALSKRSVPTGGLRPGRDGALLTGDRALLHVKLTVKYYLGTRDRAPRSSQILNYLRNVRDAEELLRAAVCNAAIRQAAERTVEAIVTTDRKDFAEQIARLAQERLDAVGSGIEVAEVKMDDSVPLAARAAFDDVIAARQDEARIVNEARADANRILLGAAGDAWAELVGDEELAAKKGRLERDQQLEVFRRYVEARRGDDAEEAEKLRQQVRRFGLLRLYVYLREEQREQLAEEVLAQVNDVLMSNRVGHAAARLINEAKAYSGMVRERVEADVERFNKLVDQYARSPELVLHRLWLPVKTELLTSPTVEKYLFGPGQKVVLRVSRDPEAARRAYEDRLKAAQQRTRQETETPRWSPRPTPPTPSSPPEH